MPSSRFLKFCWWGMPWSIVTSASYSAAAFRSSSPSAAPSQPNGLDLELRAESQNVLNHAQWGNPETGFTNPNFMKIRTYAPWRAPRTVQLGLRFAF